jgi:hypothetical protein
MALGKRQFVDFIYIIFFFIIGCLMFGISMNSFNYLNENCNTGPIYNSLVGIFAIGIAMIAISISFFGCNLTKKCYFEENLNSQAKFYMSLFFLISLTLVILSIVILSSLNKNEQCSQPTNKQDADNMKKFKFSVVMLVVFSIVMFLSTIFVGIYDTYLIPTKFYGVGEKEQIKPATIPVNTFNTDSFFGSGF